MTQNIIVIGAGMATGRTLEHLFDANADVNVTLFNAEPRGNYNRIMLSPVLAGDKTYEEIVTHDADWYDQKGVTCRFGERVAGIDRANKTVTADNGDVLPYDKLIFGTGSNPFMIPLPGHDLEGVIAYRDLEDTERMLGLGPDNKPLQMGRLTSLENGGAPFAHPDMVAPAVHQAMRDIPAFADLDRRVHLAKDAIPIDFRRQPDIGHTGIVQDVSLGITGDPFNTVGHVFHRVVAVVPTPIDKGVDVTKHAFKDAVHFSSNGLENRTEEWLTTGYHSASGGSVSKSGQTPGDVGCPSSNCDR